MDRIQAAKLGVTFTEFRKDKENILKDKKNVSYDSPVYHPYLTTNYFYEYKKNKLHKLQKSCFPRETMYNPKHTDESEDMSSNNIENYALGDDNFNDIFNPKIPEENMNKVIESIDGLGLNINPIEKSHTKTGHQFNKISFSMVKATPKATGTVISHQNTIFPNNLAFSPILPD